MRRPIIFFSFNFIFSRAERSGKPPKTSPRLKLSPPSATVAVDVPSRFYAPRVR